MKLGAAALQVQSDALIDDTYVPDAVAHALTASQRAAIRAELKPLISKLRSFDDKVVRNLRFMNTIRPAPKMLLHGLPVCSASRLQS